MLSRCENPKHVAFGSYGGAGIKVCNRWHSFESFVEDLGWRPEGKTLDRIDNSKGYEPGNARWATGFEQHRNRTDNHRLTHEGVCKTITEWASESGIGLTTIRARLLRGWSIAEALRPERIPFGFQKNGHPTSTMAARKARSEIRRTLRQSDRTSGRTLAASE